MIRSLDQSERERIAAGYGIAPGNITTLVRIAPPAHASAGVSAPMPPREVLNLWYRNQARAKRIRAATELEQPKPSPLPAAACKTWGEM